MSRRGSLSGPSDVDLSTSPAIFARDPVALARERFDLRTRAIPVDGTPMSVVDVGDGPALLFVHGAPSWSLTWRGVIGRLRERFRCIAPDMPGFGGSPQRPGNPVSARSCRDALVGLLDTLDLERVVLVANDTGGVAGFGAAVCRPDRFVGLVAAGTFAYRLDRYPRVRVMLRLASSGPFRWLNRHTALLPRLVLGPGTPGRRIPVEERADVLAAFRAAPQRDAAIDLLGSLVRDPGYLGEVEDGLPGLRDRPLLTVFGQRDPTVPAGFPEGFDRFFARRDLVEVAGAAHFAHEDNPTAVARAIEAWFARRVARPGA